MSLKKWAENGWLREHKTSKKEISDLFKIVERDLNDAGGDISPDWKFGIAYNAALKLCTVLLFSEGYRAETSLQHYRTIQALPLIMGGNYEKEAHYLDACRNKRNTTEYEYAGAISSGNAAELIEFVREFRDDVASWLKDNHPDLI